MSSLSRFLIIAGSACVRSFIELLAFVFVLEFGTFRGYQGSAGQFLVIFPTDNLHCSEHPSFFDSLHLSEIGYD